MITCILLEELDFFVLSDLRDLELDLGSSHTAYHYLSLTDVKANFVKIGKKLLVDGWTYESKDEQTLRLRGADLNRNIDLKTLGPTSIV